METNGGLEKNYAWRLVRFLSFWFSAMLLAVMLTIALSVARASPSTVLKTSTLTVNTLVDENDGSCSDGDCSLRDAVQVAAAGDTIDFSVTGTITLTLNRILIAKNLTINGPGAENLTVSGNNASGVFFVGAKFNVNISNLTIAKGKDGIGDGALSTGGRVNVTNCTFFDNGASNGGGIYNANTGVLTVTHCVFVNNRAASGGGIKNFGTLSVSDSTFSGNTATSWGGGIYNRSAATILTVTNCTFSGNAAYDGGGIFLQDGTLVATNNTFSGNTATRTGGGIYHYNGTATVVNSTFSSNSAGEVGGSIASGFGVLIVTNSTFTNSLAVEGGGITNWAQATVTDSTFSGNTANTGVGGGGILNYGTITVTHSTFSSNRALKNDAAGGGILNRGTLHVNRSIFSGNQVSLGSGGGIANGGALDMTNSTVFSNTAQWGGGVYNRSTSTVINTTFFSNTAVSHGGGMYNNAVNPALKNVILWGDSAPNGPEIYNNSSIPVIAYSDIQGSGGSGAAWNASLGSDGGGNIDAAPLFAGATGGDLHLQSNSPGIDAGDNTAVPVGVTSDLDGKRRFADVPAVPDTGNGTPPIVDMGAYEAQEVRTVYLPLVLRNAP